MVTGGRVTNMEHEAPEQPRWPQAGPGYEPRLYDSDDYHRRWPWLVAALLVVGTIVVCGARR